MGGAAARARARPKPASGRHAPRAERWLSGRKHRTRNAAYGQPYRGFESHPLRQKSIKLLIFKEKTRLRPKRPQAESCWARALQRSSFNSRLELVTWLHRDLRRNRRQVRE